jgi:hypothetical protein
MSEIPRKLQEIRKLTLKQKKKANRRYMGIVFCFVMTAILIVVLLVVVPFMFPEEPFPLLLISPISWFIPALSFFLLIIVMFLLVTAREVPFEKSLFLITLEAYEHLARFISLSGSSSQDESDLDEAKKLLRKVSSKLLGRRLYGSSHETWKEVIKKYVELGKGIETKIIYNVKERKNLDIIQHKILELANTFADVSLSRIDSCIQTIEAIKETGPFTPKPAFFESHLRLRSAIIHGGKFLVSILLVLAVAVILSIALSTPLSEFAPYILASTFVLLVGWEFKSRGD